MSKIEKYKEMEQIYKDVKRQLNLATGGDKDGNLDTRNDKHSLSLSYTTRHDSSFNDAYLKLHASYGYYGSFSGYSAMDKNVASYMTKALSGYLIQAKNLAIAMARADMLKAKEEAKEEALEVLKEVE